MQYLNLSFQVIFPILVLITLGYYIQRKKLTDAESFRALNRAVFRLFLPTKLFLDIYEADLRTAFNLPLLIFTAVTTLICYVFLIIMVPKFVKGKREQPVIIQGIYRSNFIIFGLTMAASIYKNQDISQVSVLAAFIVPLFNMLAVIVFELFRDQRPPILKLSVKIIQNPLIIGGMLGFAVSLLKITIPAILLDSIETVAKTSSPLAMVCLGGTFVFQGLIKYKKELIAVALGKLIIVPAVILALAVLMGFRGLPLAAIMIVYASPTASSSFPMAQEMGGNEELAGNIVVVTAVLSLFSLFFFIFILSGLSLI